MPSELMMAAIAYRKKQEELVQIASPNMTDAKKLDYLNVYPKYDPDNEGYGLKTIVNYNGKLYENLMAGNKMSPDEYSYAWRWIDPEATNLEDL